MTDLHNYIKNRNGGFRMLSIDEVASECLLEPSEVKENMTIKNGFVSITSVVRYLEEH